MLTEVGTNMEKIYEDFNERFVNPYNFIPLGKECRREISGEDGCYTGYFECSMRLLTPLFIPNTSSSVRLLKKSEFENGMREGHKKEYKGYDFFSYEDYSNVQPYIDNPPPPPSNPVIPGSEIRGAVRSVYEAAFNGCMSSVDGDRDLSGRCGEAKKPGLLYWDKKKKGWYLEPCRKARLCVQQKNAQSKENQVSRTLYDSWEEGQEIWVDIDKRGLVKGYKVNVNVSEEKQMLSSYYRKGYLHKGEYINKKNCEAVFYMVKKIPESSLMKVYDEDIELLNKILNEYRDDKKNSKAQNRGWYKEFNIKKDGSYNLVYYERDNQGHTYLCPACIGREAFKKKLRSLLENNGGYQPCNSKKLCPACQIFGMMEKAEKPETYAYGSKVRITDARLVHPVNDSSALFEDPIVLCEQGEPRPSAVEFYTKSPYAPHEKYRDVHKQGYWTYDYKCVDDVYSGGREKNERVALNKNLPQLRGRKYYWHSEVKMEEFEGNNVSTMRQRIRPLKASTESDLEPAFQFRVYFEALNRKQIEQLKWALDFGNPECAHKIGRGKPLGFGSVQIMISGLHIREIDENTGKWNLITIGEREELSYDSFFGESGFDSTKIPDALKIMSNWIKRPAHVRYPMGESIKNKKQQGDNEVASHQWFRINKGENRYKYNFSKVLPDAKDDAKKELEKDKALYKLISIKR